jgi:DNA mismatch endonuclease, patch repair protein
LRSPLPAPRDLKIDPIQGCIYQSLTYIFGNSEEQIEVVDIVSKETRSRMMSGIRSKGTRPEMIVRRHLHALGFRYRLHVGALPGKPDLVFPKHRTVIFVHGCFWHRHAGCSYATSPRTNTEFWAEKLESNVRRDKAAVEKLVDLGWRIIVIWECSLRNKLGINHALDWLSSALKDDPSKKVLVWPEP